MYSRKPHKVQFVARRQIVQASSSDQVRAATALPPITRATPSRMLPAIHPTLSQPKRTFTRETGILYRRSAR